jgi:hypothetical protein
MGGLLILQLQGAAQQQAMTRVPSSFHDGPPGAAAGAAGAFEAQPAKTPASPSAAVNPTMFLMHPSFEFFAPEHPARPVYSCSTERERDLPSQKRDRQDLNVTPKRSLRPIRYSRFAILDYTSITSFVFLSTCSWTLAS